MGVYTFTRFAAIAAILLISHAITRADDRVEQFVERWQKAEGNCSRLNLLASFLASSSLKDIESLENSKDLGLALSISWAKVMKVAEAGLVQKKGNGDRIRVPKAALAEFIGYVQGRLGVTPPDYWRTRLAKGSCWKSGGCSFPSGPRGGEKERKFQDRAQRGRGNIRVSVNAEQVAFTDVQTGRSIELKRERLKEWEISVDDGLLMGGIIDEDHCIFCPSSGGPGSTLYSLSSKEPFKRQWEEDISVICGGFSGQTDYSAEIVLKGDDIIVFSSCTSGMAIDAFSLEGKRRFSFMTDFELHTALID